MRFGLSEVKAWVAAVPPALSEQVKKRTEWSASKVEVKLRELIDRTVLENFVGTGSPEISTLNAVAPALRRDVRGAPMVTLEGRRYLTHSTRRASTGTHYTPPQLAERIVAGALEPLVYRPGPLQIADRSKWVLRPSVEIRSLRIADIAMGSGAFLVSACRYLADRLLEARSAEGEENALRVAKQSAQGLADAEASLELLSARREIADRCLYGVDINQLAVEMAKLSLWLLTMDPQRPFGFLDDRLVVGDSLLGLVNAKQLLNLNVEPKRGELINEVGLDFSDSWSSSLKNAADSRRRIAAHGVSTFRDIEFKQNLLEQARKETAALSAVADYLTGIGLANSSVTTSKRDAAFIAARISIGNNFKVNPEKLLREGRCLIESGNAGGSGERIPLHWPSYFLRSLLMP